MANRARDELVLRVRSSARNGRGHGRPHRDGDTRPRRAGRARRPRASHRVIFVGGLQRRLAVRAYLGLSEAIEQWGCFWIQVVGCRRSLAHATPNDCDGTQVACLVVAR